MAKLNEPNPFDDDDSNMPLRQVTLESVAEYLRCEPERLAKALSRRNSQCCRVRPGRERLAR